MGAVILTGRACQCGNNNNYITYLRKQKNLQSEFQSEWVYCTSAIVRHAVSTLRRRGFVRLTQQGNCPIGDTQIQLSGSGRSTPLVWSPSLSCVQRAPYHTIVILLFGRGKVERGVLKKSKEKITRVANKIIRKTLHY